MFCVRMEALARHVLCALCMISIACNTGRPARSAGAAIEQPESARPASLDQPVSPYPGGSWRTTEDPNAYALMASHILVSHDQAVTGPLLMAAPARSKAEALRKANTLHAELVVNPKGFAEIAQRDSDDTNTAPLGGWIGVIYANSAPEQWVSAFDQLKTGEISRVIESEYGYHIVRREAESAPIQLAYSHIVIKPNGSYGWFRLDRPAPQRGVDEALTAAEEVARQAKTDPTRFAELARELSDAEDALRGGEMGNWSSQEPSGDELLVLARVARLAVGEVAGPLQTGSGFHVLMRNTPASKPQRMIASVIAISHSGSQLASAQGEGLATPAEAVEIGARILRQLRRDPSAFEALRSEYCNDLLCDDFTFDRGRGMFALETEMSKLQPHEISRQLVDSPIGYLIVRAQDGSDPAPDLRAAKFDLPASPKAWFEPSTFDATARPIAATE
jgi:hypothetical protein